MFDGTVPKTDIILKLFLLLEKVSVMTGTKGTDRGVAPGCVEGLSVLPMSTPTHTSGSILLLESVCGTS